MYYVGIDQSYRNSGIVILDQNAHLISFEVVQTHQCDGDYFTRARIVSDSARCFIESIYEYSDVEFEVGLEGLAFGMRGHTLQNLAGLQWLIVDRLREAGFNPVVHTPSTVKKFATGSGKAKKEDMWEALPENVKKMFESVTKAHGREDLADAYWIAMKTKG